MKASLHRRNGPSALDMVEEAVHLLRGNPSVLTWYYIGTVPFSLILLFFCAEMGQSALAEKTLSGTALLTACAYLWMKCCHSVFAWRLGYCRRGLLPKRLSFGAATRIFVAQAAVQPTALFALPIACVLTLPYGWVSAFYQSVTVLGQAENGSIRALARNACREAMQWPKQNHLLLLVLIVFAFFVFLNWCAVAMTLPGMVKMFLGYESVFTRAGMALFNTTFIMAMGCLTFLVVDPIRKSAYVLRCFYSRSLSTGEDIKAELQELSARAAGTPTNPALRVAVTLLISFFIVCTASSAEVLSAASESQRSSITGVSKIELESPRLDTAMLDDAIDGVLAQPKFAWRLPRQAAAESEKGIIGRFMDRARETVNNRLRSFWTWLKDLLDILFKRRQGSHTGAGLGWVAYLEVLVYALAAALVIAIVLLIARMLKSRKVRAELTSIPLKQDPNLSDESVRADELPQGQWLLLGKELLERGELRLAMRAFFLASLAHLSERGMVRIARFKSNLDYKKELDRRAHALPELADLFSSNVAVFERAWYGNHSVDRLHVDQFCLAKSFFIHLRPLIASGCQMQIRGAVTFWKAVLSSVVPFDYRFRKSSQALVEDHRSNGI